jgi:tetratricopeptide (TPR) repeat protein
MKQGKRLWGLGLAGVVLVSGALWARRQWDPERFHAVPLPQLERWVEDHPEDGDALYEIGRRYRQDGQLADARQALERAQRIEPGNASLLTDLGELYAADGAYPRAQALFEQAMRLRPDLPAPHRRLGDLAGIAQNYVLAIQRYREAVALDPRDAETLTSLGTAYADALNRGEAEAAFGKAIALAPRSADAYQRLGLARYKLNDNAGARAALQQALTLNPNDPSTHLFLGLAMARQLRTPEDERQALQQFDQAEALGYSGGEAAYGRGLVALHRRDYTHAIAALQAAIRREGGGEDARYRLVRAYFAAGQPAKGQAMQAQFQRFKETEPEARRLRFRLALQPADTAARRRLADLCVATGRYREALLLQRALLDAGAGDGELFRAMLRAAQAVGDAQAEEQAKDGLRHHSFVDR